MPTTSSAFERLTVIESEGYILNIDLPSRELVAYVTPSRPTGPTVRNEIALRSKFSNGVAVAAKQVKDTKQRSRLRKFGLIDARGEIVLPFEYDDISPFVDGRATVMIEGPRVNDPREYGIINDRGKWIVEIGKYRYLSRYAEGRCAFSDTADQTGPEVGFLDRGGNVAISPRASRIYSQRFSSGRCLMQPKWPQPAYYIDTKGEVAITLGQDTFPEPFSEGLAVLGVIKEPGERRYGYINRAGQFVIPPLYGWALGFSEGLAAVCNVDPRHPDVTPEGQAIPREIRWGFIDAKGGSVIRMVYEDVRSFSEGLAACQFRGQWGFLDKKGKMVITPRYDEILQDFRDGCAAVSVRGQIVVINMRGDLLIETSLPCPAKF